MFVNRGKDEVCDVEWRWVDWSLRSRLSNSRGYKRIYVCRLSAITCSTHVSIQFFPSPYQSWTQTRNEKIWRTRFWTRIYPNVMHSVRSNLSTTVYLIYVKHLSDSVYRQLLPVNESKQRATRPLFIRTVTFVTSPTATMVPASYLWESVIQAVLILQLMNAYRRIMPFSVQNRVLKVRDILDVIFSFIDRDTALQCTMVCRSWRVPAIVALLRHLDDESDFVNLLLPHLVQRKECDCGRWYRSRIVCLASSRLISPHTQHKSL